MGYFLCFDASDHTHESLKEAVSLHKMLAQTRPRWLKRKLQPIIALVACKTDRSSRDLEVRQILIAAQNFAESEDLTFYATSASTHRGVQDLTACVASARPHEGRQFRFGIDMFGTMSTDIGLIPTTRGPTPSRHIGGTSRLAEAYLRSTSDSIASYSGGSSGIP